MKIKKDLVNRTLLLLSLCVAGQAVGRDFLYTLKNYPVSSADCAAKAQELAGRFAQMTGHNTYASSCEEFYTTRYIYIRYSADAEVVPVSTSDPLHLLSGQVGTYRNAAECQAALAGEARVFTDETGYEVFTSYCFAESLGGAAAWVAHVDGLGKDAPRKFVFADKALVIGKVVSPAGTELVETIRAGYERMGARMRSVIFDPRSSAGEMTVTYYYDADPAKRGDVRLMYGRHGSYATLGACQIEAASADAAMKAAGVNLLKNVCAERYSNGVTELLTLHFMRRDMSTFVTGEHWQSHEECSEGRNSVFERLRNAGRESLLAVVCSYKDNVWHSVAIEQGVKKGDGQ